MEYSSANLPDRYRLPWISSPETALLEEQIQHNLISGESFWLQGAPDCGKKHLMATSVLATDTSLFWEKAGQMDMVAANHPDDNALILIIPAPSLDRRELIVAGRLQLAGVLFSNDFVSTLAGLYPQLSPLLGAVQYAIHFAVLNRLKLDTIILDDILCAYDSTSR